jgi:DNA-binding transcriptional LysR family regulator
MNEPFNDMAIFARIAEMGSFTAAAKSMGRSKAYVSQRLSSLEEMLGTQLLFRSTRKLSFTEAGKIYLEYCQDITKSAAEAKRAIAALQGQMEGSISISTTNSFGEVLLLEALLSFQQKYPNIKIDLDLSDEIRDLHDSDIDLCVRGGNVTDDQLVAIPLLNWQMYTVATAQYLEKFSTPATPAELKVHNCIGLNHEMTVSGWSYIIDGQFQRIKVNGDFTVTRNSLIKQITLAGKGLGWMPSYVLEKELKSGDLVRVLNDFEPPPFTFYLAYVYQKAMPYRQRRLIDFLKDWFSLSQNSLEDDINSV